MQTSRHVKESCDAVLDAADDTESLKTASSRAHATRPRDDHPFT
jgi:hypothetical protein